MTLTESLSNRAKEVLINGKWIANTNFKEQISRVNWEQAIQLIEGLNSIALLTYHINYYLQGLNKVFSEGVLDISDKYSFDMPPIKSESDWLHLVDTFILNAELFVANVEKMNEEKLFQNFVKIEYGNYLRNIEGVIEHSYYHLGQMVLIKKMITNQH